jgi:broad specificity phosphatase PhoE
MKLRSAIIVVTLSVSAFAQQHGTIFVVRHAERQPSAAPMAGGMNAKDDPQLTDVGRQRAACLARTLKDSGITTIITSGVTRTNQTAEPLASTLHLDIKKLPNLNETTMTAQQSAKSGNVLIVGHSNTVPEIVKNLTNASVTVPDNAYDQLFIVTESTPPQLAAVNYCPAEK